MKVTQPQFLPATPNAAALRGFSPDTSPTSSTLEETLSRTAARDVQRPTDAGGDDFQDALRSVRDRQNLRDEQRPLRTEPRKTDRADDRRAQTHKADNRNSERATAHDSARAADRPEAAEEAPVQGADEGSAADAQARPQAAEDAPEHKLTATTKADPAQDAQGKDASKDDPATAATTPDPAQTLAALTQQMVQAMSPEAQTPTATEMMPAVKAAAAPGASATPTVASESAPTQAEATVEEKGAAQATGAGGFHLAQASAAAALPEDGQGGGDAPARAGAGRDKSGVHPAPTAAGTMPTETPVDSEDTATGPGKETGKTDINAQPATTVAQALTAMKVDGVNRPAGLALEVSALGQVDATTGGASGEAAHALGNSATTHAGVSGTTAAGAGEAGTSGGTGAAGNGMEMDANVARIARGLQTALAQRGGTVSLRLTPPELGMVRIQMDVQDGVVSARFVTPHESVRNLLGHEMNQLRSALEKQGLTVERLEVQTQPINHGGSTTGQAQNPMQDAAGDGRSRGQFAQPQGGGRDSRDTGGGDDRQGGAGRSFAEQLVNMVA